MEKLNKYLLFCLLFLSQITFAQKNTKSVLLKIDGITSIKGNLMIEVVDKDENVLEQLMFKVTQSEMSVPINVQNIPCMIRIYHDVNANNEMDAAWYGKPTEPVGFSNNATGNMGPPSFEDAKVSIQANESISITLVTF